MQFNNTKKRAFFVCCVQDFLPFFSASDGKTSNVSIYGISFRLDLFLFREEQHVSK